jgi:DNA repair photolyase
MPIIKSTVSEEEKKIIEAYAAADSRSVSELLFHSAKGQINRSKKKGVDGQIIVMPDRMKR